MSDMESPKEWEFVRASYLIRIKLIRAEKWTKNRTDEKRQDVLRKLMEDLKYMLYRAWMLGCDLEINPEKIVRWWDRIKGV